MKCTAVVLISVTIKVPSLNYDKVKKIREVASHHDGTESREGTYLFERAYYIENMFKNMMDAEAFIQAVEAV